MIDKIVYWDDTGCPVYMSELYPFRKFIGYETEDKKIILYNERS